MMKKIACIVVAVCMVFACTAVLCGCGAKEAGETAPVEGAELAMPAEYVIAAEREGQTYDVDEYTIKVFDDTRDAAIIKYNGNAADVEIPEEIDGYPVACIADSAFTGILTESCNLKTVVIPDGVTAIEKQAFYKQTALQSVTMPASLTGMGDYVFEYCESLTAIVLPEGLKAVPKNTFTGCKALASCVIPSTVSAIWDNAFSECAQLSSIVLPDGLKQIGDYSFTRSGLTEIVIPSGVMSIGDGAFSGCNGAAYADIPASVTTIGDFALGITTDTFEIRADEGSAALKYAKDNSIKYRVN